MPVEDRYETHEYDVIVIGAGGAGLRAAIEASAQGARTAVVCKSLLGKAHTVMAEGGIAAALGNVWPQDNWMVHFRDTMRGGKFLTRRDRAHMQAITVEKAKVFAAWARAGRMDPVDPMHLFIMLWATTQFYADSDILAANALDARRLGPRHFDKAAEVLTAIVLKGCGIKTPRVARSAGSRSRSAITRSAAGANGV